MEAKSRPYEPVHVGMVSVESAHDRYHKLYGQQAPDIAYWRVNLTALSQQYNLYFVATCDRIQVYVPTFPYQTLGGKPALTIVPRLNNPAALGYIDPGQPHSVNHVLVGNLGNQEILLFSTDSGNVVAYHTSSIDAAIHKNAYKFSVSGDADLVGVRPFFSQWLHESAWGLAIHREARMLAISANRPHHVNNDDPSSKITVFAFALTTTVEDAEEDETNGQAGQDGLIDHHHHVDWHLWSTSSDGSWQDVPPRDRNYKIVLGGPRGHGNNVPCITFVNNAEDACGTWLLSTDITGQLKMWQIWTGRCLQTWDFNRQDERATPWTQQREAGWLVAALDPNSFRPARTMRTFVGHNFAPQYYGSNGPGDTFDLTTIVPRFTPQNNALHPFVRQHEGDTSDEEEDELIGDAIDSEGEANAEPLLYDFRIRPPGLSSSGQSESVELHESSKVSVDSALNVPTESGGGGGGDDDDDDDDDDDVDDDSETFETFTDHAMDIEILGDLSEHVDDDGDDDDNEDDNDSSDDDDVDDHDDDDDDDDSDGDTDSEDEEEHDDDDDSVPPESINDSSFNHPRNATSSMRHRPPYRDGNRVHDDIVMPDTGHAGPPFAADAPQPRYKQDQYRQSEKPSQQPQCPQIPIMYCSTSHVRLLKNPMARDPHLFCARMLRQQLPAGMENTNFAVLDRLSMLHQIPELGIVLIATQLGRCAVCSLTRRAWLPDGLVGFRVDWILPTKRQEREGARPPNHVLLGIAASPIQGRAVPQTNPISAYDTDENWARDREIDGIRTTFDPKVVVLRSPPPLQPYQSSGYQPDREPRSTHVLVERRAWKRTRRDENWVAHESSRRYRLILTYSDMSILSYELSRGVEREDVAGSPDPDR